ncbi:hypothetical protein [Kaistia sp. MMO-174]|uniref:hypothetical protein n=1 Tax=Kaistia sp. MMO-174 TaxID=3081256 RepID=UPI00301B24CF
MTDRTSPRALASDALLESAERVLGYDIRGEAPAYTLGALLDLVEAMRADAERERSRPANTLALIHLRTGGGPSHGGWRVYRYFALYLNGIEIRRYSDFSALDGYAAGPELDRRIAEDVLTFERALGCKSLRGRARSEAL